MNHTVKRHGRSEKFDPRKLYASIYSACMSIRMPEGQAELIADNVVKDVLEDIASHVNVESKTLFLLVCENLQKYNEDAAYMYRTHREID